MKKSIIKIILCAVFILLVIMAWPIEKYEIRDGGSWGVRSVLYDVRYEFVRNVSEEKILNLDDFEDSEEVCSRCVYKEIHVKWFPFLTDY